MVKKASFDGTMAAVNSDAFKIKMKECFLESRADLKIVEKGAADATLFVALQN